MRSTIAVLILGMMMFGASLAMAGDRVAVDLKELTCTYEAAKAARTVKPERVYYAPGREVEGYVTLELTVDDQGMVENARVLFKTSNLAVQNAVDAVSKWVFEPATLDGKPVSSRVAYSLPFGPDLEILQADDYEAKVMIEEQMVTACTQ